MKKHKKWLTLNAHGKRCLSRYIHALSTSDILTTQLDYLNSKGLVDSFVHAYSAGSIPNRVPHAGECLTDMGVETVKHYFPNYYSQDAIIEDVKFQ